MFKTVFLIILFFIYTHIFIIYIFYKEINKDMNNKEKYWPLTNLLSRDII